MLAWIFGFVPLPPAFGGNDMRTGIVICRWLSSFLICLVISGIAFAGLNLAYELFDLQKRINVDDDVCWLALLIGPALIVFIHRVFHRRTWVAVSTFVGGVLLAGLGVLRFMSAHKAEAHHVPSGPFSGIEYDFRMLVGVYLGLLAVLAISGAWLALAARRIQRRAEPCAGGTAAAPRA